MSSLYKNYKMDEKKVADGIRHELSPNEDGTIPTFILLRAHKSNHRYSKALEVATRPYQRQLQLKTMDNMLAETIQRRVFIETVLLGWENVLDKDNKQIAYNAENAERLFVDFPDLYEELMNSATNSALFLEDTLENQAKN